MRLSPACSVDRKNGATGGCQGHDRAEYRPRERCRHVYDALAGEKKRTLRAQVAPSRVSPHTAWPEPT